MGSEPPPHPGRFSHGWIVQHRCEAIGYLDAKQNTEHDRSVAYLAPLLLPASRSRGFACEVVQEALALPEFAAATELIAYVEPDNHPARPTLPGAGFIENGTAPPRTRRVLLASSKEVVQLGPRRCRDKPLYRGTGPGPPRPSIEPGQGPRRLLTEDVARHVPGRNVVAGEYRGRDDVVAYTLGRRVTASGTRRMHPREMLVGTSTT